MKRYRLAIYPADQHKSMAERQQIVFEKATNSGLAKRQVRQRYNEPNMTILWEPFPPSLPSLPSVKETEAA